MSCHQKLIKATKQKLQFVKIRSQLIVYNQLFLSRDLQENMYGLSIQILISG